MSAEIEALYRAESRRIFSTLVRKWRLPCVRCAALRTPHFSAYSLQAAISAVHAEAPTATETDWRQIAGLYDALLSKEPSPVVALNRAVAVALASGPAVGLPLVTALLQADALQNDHLA